MDIEPGPMIEHKEVIRRRAGVLADIGEDVALRRELPTYRPLYWYELPTGPERDALRAKQEDPTYRYFSR